MGNSVSNFSTADAAKAEPEEKVDPAAAGEAAADEVIDAAASAVEVSDELHGTLHVMLTRVEDVEDVSLSGPMNLQVKSTFLGQTFKSPVSEGAGQSADFGYEFTLPLDGVLGTLFVEVAHMDGVSANTVGFGDVPVKRLAAAAEPEAFDITRDGETPVGRCYFKSRFEPAPHMA